MAYLYETATWRSIVRATRNPKVMAAFVVISTGGACALAKGSELLTAPASEETKKEMEKVIQKDYEAGRYARHSKQALALMFDSFKKDGDKEITSEASQKPKIKLPGVMWHPKVERLEREAKLAAEKRSSDKAMDQSPNSQSSSTSKMRREVA